MLGGYKYKTRVEGICSAFDPVHKQKGVESFDKGRMCNERLCKGTPNRLRADRLDADQPLFTSCSKIHPSSPSTPSSDAGHILVVTWSAQPLLLLFQQSELLTRCRLAHHWHTIPLHTFNRPTFGRSFHSCSLPSLFTSLASWCVPIIMMPLFVITLFIRKNGIGIFQVSLINQNLAKFSKINKIKQI